MATTGHPDNSGPATDPLRTLSTVFGYSAFRPNQREIIDHILSGRDVFAVMATGGGKSLCYQLPAVLREGTAVVVSPLISLMKDQVDAARANGIAAAVLNSSQTSAERKDVLTDLRAGRLTLLYLAPERLAMDGFLDRLATVRLSLLCIDEAHCISEWGHDFRPDYLKLSGIAERLAGVPVVAFTATATQQVQDDIVARLALRSPFVLRASFNRPNLYLDVQRKNRGEQQVLKFIEDRPGQSGIVYCRTRKRVESIARFLQEHGLQASAYHAGFDDAARTAVQDDFKHDRVRVIVATVAFGMGIDKPDIRFVVHADLPQNIESYYQEIGRAGRDGDDAYCLLLFSPGDIAKARFFVDRTEDASQRQTALDKLNQMAGFASHNVCRRRQLLAYFGERLDADNCGRCDICRGTAEQVDATVDAQKLLSAVARTQERFGTTHVVDIVVGAKTDRIRQRGHDRLKTYGAGRDKDRKYWLNLAHDLIAQELLAQDGDRYPVLKLTAAAKEVLGGNRTVTILKRHVPKAAGRSRTADEGAPYDAGLFERLRDLRTRFAQSKGVPAYVIFGDRTLRDMCRRLPATLSEMMHVHGVGQAKLQQYGDDFLREIAAYFAHRKPTAPAETTSRRNSAGASRKRRRS
ncbi:MAG: DNA helicase RecQ [Planctomycetes bacterium]|nr:DNA helicase RecQ [Planctomycetota bacterium]